MKINKHAFWQLKINKFYLIAFVAVVILGGVIAQVAPDAFCSNNPDKCIQLFPAGTTDNFGNPLDEETSDVLPHSDNERFKFTNNDSGQAYFIPFEGQNELKQAAVSSRTGYLDGKIEICVDGQSEQYSIDGEEVPGCGDGSCVQGATCTDNSQCGDGSCFGAPGNMSCQCGVSGPQYYGCATDTSTTMTSQGACTTSDPTYNNVFCTGPGPAPTPVGPLSNVTCCDNTPVLNECAPDTGGDTNGDGDSGSADGHLFVCGVDGNWKMGPSANSTIPASTGNYNSGNACSGATAPINNDAGAGGQDFHNPDMRCWDAVPSNCSCFTPGQPSPPFPENC